MATSIVCPRCTHQNRLDDAKAGKPVHCRICHHELKPAATGSAAAPAAPPAKKAEVPVLELAPGQVKAGPPKPPTRAEASTSPTPPKPTKSRRDQDDDGDRRRPRSRRPAKSGGIGVIYWVLGGVGAVLCLGCCGVVGVGVMFMGWLSEQAPPVIVLDGPPMIVQPPIGGPAFIVPAQQPPQARLNPNDPADLPKALQMLNQGGEDFKEACRWFRAANVDIPRRNEVARALEGRLVEQQQQVFVNNDYFEAYFRWATAENLPSLVLMVQDGDFGKLIRRQQAIATLGRLKDIRAVEPLVQRLKDFHDRNAVTRALEQLGPMVQPTLVRHVNDRDRDVRQAVRDLLKKQNVGPDVLVPQTVTDLNAPDEQVRTAALELLGQTPANDRNRLEVVRALNALINPKSLEGPLLKALETWGTADNALTVANNLNPANFFAFQQQLKFLARFRDARTVPALTARFPDGGLVRLETMNVLKQFGKVAEPEVVKLLLSPDMGTRHDACRLLADIGTLNVTGPALQQAVRAYPMDRQLEFHGRTTLKRIQSRGA